MSFFSNNISFGLEKLTKSRDATENKNITCVSSNLSDKQNQRQTIPKRHSSKSKKKERRHPFWQEDQAKSKREMKGIRDLEGGVL